MNTFSNLGLSENLLKAVSEIGFTEPSEIQEKAIPFLKNNSGDFIGIAQTGTGKTAAFGLPLLDLVSSDNKFTQALILSPTRELGQQIAVQLNLFAKYHKKISVQVVYGGASISEQIRSVKKNTPHILVATPGRLYDMIKRKAVNLSDVQYVVLDEADEMLNMGFKEDLNNILSYTPESKATWLFSATMPSDIRAIVKSYMKNPEEIKVNRKESTNKNIEHQYAVVSGRNKAAAVQRILEADTDARGIVFCRTKRDTQNVSDTLISNGISADTIHGDLSQSQRDEVMAKFRKRKIKVMVATDVAARGIDVEDLTHIINFNIPDDFAFYTHRSGRTARAGKKGISLLMLSPDELRKMRALQHKLDINFKKIEIPGPEEIAEKKLDRFVADVLEADDANLPGALVAKAEQELSALNKNQLIKKLIAMKLKSFDASGADLNLSEKKERKERDGKRGKRERLRKGFDGRSKKKSADSPDQTRFFINIGSKDQVRKQDLRDLVSDQAGISKKSVGDISLLNKFSYFSVDNDVARKVIPSFKGMTVEGRKLRVTPDDGK